METYDWSKFTRRIPVNADAQKIMTCGLRLLVLNIGFSALQDLKTEMEKREIVTITFK